MNILLKSPRERRKQKALLSTDRVFPEFLGHMLCPLSLELKVPLKKKRKKKKFRGGLTEVEIAFWGEMMAMQQKNESGLSFNFTLRGCCETGCI